MMHDKEVAVCAAKEEDAQPIYDLMEEAFGANYLYFTIYRSPKIIAYIERLIASGDQSFIIAKWRGKLAGYANVCYIKHQAILSYIAVTRTARGFGIGSRLLHAVESKVHAQGFSSLFLDAFESNASVVDWYIKAGYSVISESFLYRIELASAMHKNKKPIPYSSHWREAIADEERNGFSKVIERTTESEITLGLIGGIAGKLLEYRGASLEKAIEDTIAMVNFTRNELIICSKQPPDESYRLLSLETSLRMVKAL